jgi:hypothetical protein
MPPGALARSLALSRSALFQWPAPGEFLVGGERAFGALMMMVVTPPDKEFCLGTTGVCFAENP